MLYHGGNAGVAQQGRTLWTQGIATARPWLHQPQTGGCLQQSQGRRFGQIEISDQVMEFPGPRGQ
jgi:hypothetical protein